MQTRQPRAHEVDHHAQQKSTQAVAGVMHPQHDSAQAGEESASEDEAP